MNYSQNELIIEPGRGVRHYWRDLWHYRELFYFLAWRDLLVRYKQTVIGILWSILRPFLTMVVFTIVFSKLIKLPSDNVPYPVLVYAALLPWQFFANTLAESSTSLIDNQNLLTKSIGLCLRLRALDFSTQCAIPGFSVCGAVHDPVRAVYLPGRFQQQHRAGTVAHALLPQSHGRSYRRVPLGHYRQNRYNLLAGVLALRSIGGTDLYKWFLVFQKNGKKFC